MSEPVSESVSESVSADVDVATAVARLLAGLPPDDGFSSLPRVAPPIRYGIDVTQDPAGYQRWLESNAGRWAAEEDAALRELGGGGPTISICVPVYRPEARLLDAAVASVRKQRYERWELCLCDDASPDGGVTTAELARLAALDARIKVTARRENGGISRATNDAVALATGEFVMLLDQDDELANGALALVAQALVGDGTVDVLYADEDKLDLTGARVEPYFKPDWSPDLLLSNMYLGHPLVVRRSLWLELGGERPERDGSQDYDLALRATARARTVAHVPRIAYHWRKTEGSTALDYTAKPQSDIAARAALADALAAHGEEGEIEDGMHEGTFRIRRRIDDGLRVSIIVPFRDGTPLLDLCVRTLHETIAYPHWELVLVDNDSGEPETRAYCESLAGHQRVRLLSYPGDFNWSAINNFAAAQCDSDVLLFLNSDIEARHDGWLEAMLEHAQRPEIGVVGSRLLYPDGRIQHAGVVLGLGGGVAWHAFCFLPGDHPGYFAQPRVVRNWSAVTGACMMTRRDVFERLGRFDETLAVAFNDIDYCLRAGAEGLRVVYTPFAELVHHESAARGRASLEAVETLEMFRRWEPVIRSDPYFNPNLDPLRAEYSVSVGSEKVSPWDWTKEEVQRSLADSGVS